MLIPITRLFKASSLIVVNQNLFLVSTTQSVPQAINLDLKKYQSHDMFDLSSLHKYFRLILGGHDVYVIQKY